MALLFNHTDENMTSDGGDLKLEGTALSEIGLDTFATTAEPNGFINPETMVTCTWSDSTPDRTLSIGPASGSLVYYSDGLKYTKTGAETIQIDATEGEHYIYYDGATLSKTTTFTESLITEKAFVAVIYWDLTNSKQIYFGREYLHTTKMGGKTHAMRHQVYGFVLQSGGGLTDMIVDASGDLDSHAEFGADATQLWDEDAHFSYSARISTANLPVYYKLGLEASNIFRINEADSFPVLNTGTGRAAWNELTGGSWQLSEVTNNDFVLAHVAFTNDTDRPVVVFMGQAKYGTANLARAGATTELNSLITTGLPLAEFKFVATVILQTSDGYANTPQSRIVSTDTGADYVDWRGALINRDGISGTASDHSALLNLDADDHLQYLRTDGARELTGDWTTGAFSLIGSDHWYLKADDAKMYFGAGDDGEIYVNADNLNIANVTQDKDIIFGINDGGVSKTITWNGAADLLQHSAGTFNFDNDNLTTTGVVTGNTLTSSVAIGTPPLNITSTTLATNLNADLLDGKHANEFDPAGAAAAITFDNLSPMTTLGDIIYGGVSGTGTRLGIGTEDQVLSVSAGGIPEWADASGGAFTADGSFAAYQGTNVDAGAGANVGSFAQGSVVTASGNNGSFAQGHTALASGSQGSFAQGYKATASGSKGCFAQGVNTTSTGDSGSFAQGSNATAANSAGVFAQGNAVTASATSSWAQGTQTVANKIGQFARSTGMFASNGDAQASQFVIRREVTHSDANWYQLFTDGSAGLLTIATDTCWTFECLIVGATTGQGKAFSFKIEGCIQNDGGTTAILGNSITNTIYDGDDTDFNARASADNANDALLIEVSDATSGGDTVRWVASLRIAEITYA